MTDHLPTRLTDDVVSGLPVSVARQELLEEIMSTPVIDTVESPPRPPRRTRGWAIAVAAAAAVALVVAVPLWASAGRPAGAAVRRTGLHGGARGPHCTRLVGRLRLRERRGGRDLLRRGWAAAGRALAPGRPVRQLFHRP